MTMNPRQPHGGSPDPAETGDEFGSALASGDFDGDGFDDLAIGGSQNGPDGGGAVQAYYGSLGGLDLAGSQNFHQDSPGISGEAEQGDLFGRALAAGDFDGDGFADLAIGAPNEGLGALAGVGEVTILPGYPDGLSPAGGQLWSQNSAGVPGADEQGDEFASALAVGDFNGSGHADLVVGAPRESVEATGDGAEWVLYGSLFSDGFDNGSTSRWSAVAP